MDDQVVPFALEIGKIAVFIIGFFIILGRIFEVDVTASTGLGIGGIAIAMASKSLENLLGSFTHLFRSSFYCRRYSYCRQCNWSCGELVFVVHVFTFDKSISYSS